MLVASHLVQISQNREKSLRCTEFYGTTHRSQKSVVKGRIFSEVNLAFRWVEHDVGKIKRSLCDFTLRLTPHKPVVTPF